MYVLGEMFEHKSTVHQGGMTELLCLDNSNTHTACYYYSNCVNPFFELSKKKKTQ